MGKYKPVMRYNMTISRLLILFLCVPSTSWAGWLFYNTDTIASKINSATHKGVVAVGYDSKVVACGSQDKTVQTFASGAWSAGWASGASATPTTLFVDSNEYIFISFDDSQNLYRSTDGGANFSSVKSTATANTEAIGVTEDDDGNLYFLFYPTYELYYSSDDGATWSAVPLPTNYATIYTNHLHSVHWDEYRDVLILAGGDNTVPAAELSYTSLKGAAITAASWSQMSGTRQAVGVTSDATNVYYSVDTAAGQGDIDKVSYPVGGSPGTVSVAYDGPDTGGWSWWGFTDPNTGYIYFNLASGASAGKLLVSYDGGLSFTAEKTFSNGKGIKYFALPSAYLTTWDGFLYGGEGGDPYLVQYIGYPDNRQMQASSAGDDWTNYNNWSKKTAESYQRFVSGSSTLDLGSSLAGPFYLYTDSLELNGHGYGFTGDVDTATDFSTDIEGATPFNGSATYDGRYENGGTIDDISTTLAYSGTQSTEYLPSANSYNLNANMIGEYSTGAGAWAYLGGVFRVAQAVTADTEILRLQGSGVTASLYIDSSAEYYVKLVGQAASSQTYTQGESPATISADTWTKIDFWLYASETAGQIVVKADGEEVFRVVGVDTFKTATTYTTALWNFVANSSSTDRAYWDNIYASDVEPYTPSALTVDADSATVAGLLQTETIDVNGASNTIEASVLSGANAELQIDGASNTAHNLTVYGTTTGIDANVNATVKNSIFNNNTADIDSAATVTGSNNIFDGLDPAAGYSGTSDQENTDPLFISTTDFRLRGNSPARRTGTNGDDVGAYQTNDFSTDYLDFLFDMYSPGYPLGSTYNAVTISIELEALTFGATPVTFGAEQLYF